ncbi:MAG: WcaI family glycosyltransferase [Synechococcales cyanobacterium]
MAVRILIYGLNYAPERTGIGKYTGEMAAWLVTQGHEVHVVTTPPYYPMWQVDASYWGWAYRCESVDGVQVYRCPLWVKPNPSGLERLLHLASFALSSVPVILGHLFWRADVVMVLEPAFFCVPMGLLVARLGGSRSWLHIQDFEIDAAFDLGIIPSRWGLDRFVQRLEYWLTASFDRISTISPAMVQRLGEKGIPAAKQVLFPNWVDTTQIYPLDHPSPLRTELGIPPEALVVLYAGNMGKKQGLELLIEVAAALHGDPAWHFVLCGDGVSRQTLQEQVSGRQLTNVTFLPLQPIERLNELLNMADVHALIQKEASADLVMPSKLTGMLASGRPILATAQPETAIGQVFAFADCGLLVPPEDPQAWQQALLAMGRDPEKRQHWGSQARSYACQHLSQEAILADFAQTLEALAVPSRANRDEP